jgi:mono/diheme cytochrome c family protein
VTDRGPWLLASRHRVVIATLVALVLLDLGRSIFARVGYARPLSVWQPNPSVYADLKWPPGADVPAGTAAGPRIYARRCAVCHGPDGRGNGPAAPSLIPRPRDFTLGQFKYKTTPAGQPPSEADLIRTVREGLHASAMPYFGDLLSEAEVREVVGYVRSLSPRSNGQGGASLTVPPRVPDDRASRARGARLYQSQGCATCHGKDGRGSITLKDAKGYPVITRDLTAPWTFRGGNAPDQVWLRLTTGLAPGPMPSFASTTAPKERWDLVNYILSLARTPAWEPGGKLSGPGQQPDLTRRGEYLVHAEMCGLCHTEINRTGIYRADDYYLAGGMRVGAWPHGTLVSRNLTGDSATGLGAWSDDEIVAALRTGRSGGRVLTLFDMPWHWLHALSDDDATGIARYLRMLPPVRNRIPAPLHYGLIETIASKLTRPLPAATPINLAYADGLFGQTDGGAPRDWPQTWLVRVQWLVLIVGVMLFVLAGPADRRWPHTGKGWVKLVAGLVGLGILGAVAYALYLLPLLKVIPPEQLIAGATAGLPIPDSSRLRSPEQASMVTRGRYIYSGASCAPCHGASGAGGAKVSWKPMGTLWVRNITPDSETGIGRWSDEEISRAIRSGVSRDGYQLHWQGMIWDHASNWDEEDVRAVIAFLRVIPPVKHRVPADRAPAADDCTVYTFWTSESHEPGCR